ncbi:MAG: PDZ domain-containing protein, partial [Gallionella sp.]
ADTASRYLITHPHSRIVVLAGLVHVMYGDGIPERVNHRLGGNPSAIMLNGSDFKGYPGIADYLLATQGNTELPKTGKLGILIGDGADSVIVNEFTAGSAAQAANIKIGDHILRLDGIKVANMSEVKAIMFDKQPGDKVQVTVRRAAQQEIKFDVTLR